MLLMAIVAAGASYVLVLRQPNIYVAQADLLVGPGIANPASDLNVLRTSTEVMNTYVEFAKTRNIMQQVIDDLRLDIGPVNLAGMITVTPGTTTQVLNVAVRSGDQKQAIAIANSMAKALVRLYSDTAADGSPNSVGELTARAKELRAAIATSQAQIGQFESDLKAAIEARNNPAVTEQENKIKQLEEQLAAPTDPVLAKRIQDRQTRIQQLELSLKSTVNIDARRLILDELAREDGQLTAEKNQVNDARRLILEQLAQERNRLTSMQTALTQQQNQVLTQLTLERTQLTDAQRNLAALDATLQNSLSRNITLIDPAVTAPPEAGRGTLIVLFAAVGGLVLGLTLGFALESGDDSVRTPEQLAHATGVQVWGSIGRPTELLRPGPYGQMLTAPNDWRIAEAFRLLCMKLTPSGSSDVCSLLVTNFEPGEPSAQVASNLAITLTRAGKRVVLIDADLRHPTLGTLFHLENKEGLAHWLANGSRDPKLWPVEWAPGLSVLPVGATNGGPTQELVWPRIEDLIRRVQAQADMLIVAGPALSASADSFFLASHLGGVIAVAQKGRSRRKLAAETVENLRSLGIQVMGLILTDGEKPRFKSLPLPEPRPVQGPEKLPLSSSLKSHRSEPSKDIVIATFGTIVAPRSSAAAAGSSGDEESD